MMRFIYLTQALFLLVLGTLAYASDGPSLSNDSVPVGTLINNYDFLTKKQKVSLHRNLQKFLAQQAKRTKFQDKTIFEEFTSSNLRKNNRPIDLLDFLFNQAIADPENPEMFCNFGGWISTLDDAGKCIAPWRRQIRDDVRLEIFGPKYSRNHSCGGANLFRCNPLVFGGDSDGLGMCVTADDSDPQSSTQACLDKYNSEDVDTSLHIDALAESPEKLSHYLGVLAESLRYCRHTNTNVPYCDEMTAEMLNVSQVALRCAQTDDLITFLPDVITPFNIDELNSITDGLGTRAREYRRTLERRQQEAREHNRQVYDQAIAAYRELPIVQDTMERLLDNTDRCIMDSCHGTGYRNSKPTTTSVAYCARYVKMALFPPGDDGKEAFGDFSEYPWGSDAVESGDWLKEEGFVNLMEIPEMRHLTPETAPIGSFIVYDKPSSRRKYNVDGVVRGGPGHVEMRTAEDQYVSDFINSEPTTVGGERTPIGIYVKIPPEFRSQLREVPTR